VREVFERAAPAWALWVERWGWTGGALAALAGAFAPVDCLAQQLGGRAPLALALHAGVVLAGAVAWWSALALASRALRRAGRVELDDETLTFRLDDGPGLVLRRDAVEVAGVEGGCVVVRGAREGPLRIPVRDAAEAARVIALVTGTSAPPGA
jgi:hypothetical protein